MSKTDKELTVEIVNSYVTSWHNHERTNPIKSEELINIIKSVHKTLQALPEKTEK